MPKEILAPERPTNTVVYATSAGNYGVKKRIGCRYVNGKNRPVNGPTVGHIIDWKYVPTEEKKKDASSMAPALLDWADARLCDDLFSDMIPELEEVYSHGDAMKLYAMAVLGVCDPDAKGCELHERYADSFLSVLHPGIPLSRNAVSKFLSDIGKRLPLVYEFMQNRAEKAGAGRRLLIGGTLKGGGSTASSLPGFSHKARPKNRNGISALCAFGLERQGPVCSLRYPGNTLDVTSYSDFIEKRGVSKGIVVADKGFPVPATGNRPKGGGGLRRLSPPRRNDLTIKDRDMLPLEGILANEREGIQYRKRSLPDGRFLYSFRDPARAPKEEGDYLRSRKRNSGYDADNYGKKSGSFGAIVFVGDADLTPSRAWRCYASRWEIELVMRFYEHALGFDDTREHTDYSVYASEFVDFLSEALTCRMINRFKEKGLLETQTYSKMLKALKRAKKARIGDEWKLVGINPAEEERLKKLGLLPVDGPQPKRKCGRPRKQAL